MRFGIQ